MTRSAAIESISDTARWVAMYRALESERPDALFHDPFARRLAGDRGAAILARLPRGAAHAWAFAVRTAVIDELLLERVRAGADLVLNLAAGLDARPWRLALPPDLRWVDVDLPPVLEYRAAVLAGEPPRCDYRAEPADLTHPQTRADLLARTSAGAREAVVLTEGLLLYLSAEEVRALAGALHARAPLRWWITDLASPRLVRRVHALWGAEIARGGAAFRFAPREGTRFLERCGWREAAWRGTLPEARRLRRESLEARLGNRLVPLLPARAREALRRLYGCALLERG